MRLEMLTRTTVVNTVTTEATQCSNRWEIMGLRIAPHSRNSTTMGAIACSDLCTVLAQGRHGLMTEVVAQAQVALVCGDHLRVPNPDMVDSVRTVLRTMGLDINRRHSNTWATANPRTTGEMHKRGLLEIVVLAHMTIAIPNWAERPGAYLFANMSSFDSAHFLGNV